MSRSLVVNLFWLAFGIVVTATVIGMITLWPADRTTERPPELLKPANLSAEITVIAATPCPVPGQRGCRAVTVDLLEGPDEGEQAEITIVESADRLAGRGCERS